MANESSAKDEGAPKEESKAKAPEAEVLPPEGKDVGFPPNMPAGIAFLAQAKYWSARRALEAYTRALNAQTAAYRALDERERVRVNLERSLVQSEHLDDIRHIEELKVVEELAALVEATEVRGFRTRAAKALAEAGAIEAERALERVKNPPKAEAKSQRSAAEQAAEDIAQMRKDAEMIKKALIDSYGGEDKMTEEDRELLRNLDVATRNRITDRMENL